MFVDEDIQNIHHPYQGLWGHQIGLVYGDQVKSESNLESSVARTFVATTLQ